MNNVERLSILKRLKIAFQNEVLRSGPPLKNEDFEELWPTLGFNHPYFAGAQKAADVLVTAGRPVNEYELAETEMNMILGQAISELQHGLTPPPPEAIEER